VARALSAALTLALAGAAHAGAGDVLRHEEVKLANGLRVLLLPDHRAPTITVVTWYRVGSADDTPGGSGLAHLFEHLMFKGSPHVADGVMDRLVEEAGGWTNADTEEDQTVYTDLADAAALERVLWLEADRIAGLDQALDQGRLDNQRDVVLNEHREDYENLPYGMAELLILDALWPKDHPYHFPVIGYPEALRRVQLDDAKAFFHAHYAPANAVMVIAGDIDPAQARGWAERYLGWIPSAPAPAPVRAPAIAPLAAPIELHGDDDVQVPRVYLTWRGTTAFSIDEPALELATAILAGGKSSRLFQELVVKQRLAQDVFAGSDARTRGGTVQIVATARPGVDPAKLIAAMDRLVADMAAAPPDAEEVERARNTREMRFLSSLSSLTARAEQLAEYAVIAGDPDYLDRDVARFRKVTPKDVQGAVARYLGRGRVVLTISPRGPHAP
jgi:zinc protease